MKSNSKSIIDIIPAIVLTASKHGKDDSEVANYCGACPGVLCGAPDDRVNDSSIKTVRTAPTAAARASSRIETILIDANPSL